jgi:alpha-L-fucosidase
MELAARVKAILTFEAASLSGRKRQAVGHPNSPHPPMRSLRFPGIIRFLGFGFTAVGLALTVSTPARSQEDRTAWMKDARWGVMTHYLNNWIADVYHEPTTVERWNELVDHFDVDGLAEQIKSTGAGYHILTIYQQSDHFISPNAAYDRLFAPSKTAKRDLVADMADALRKRGLRLIVYITTQGPREAHATTSATRPTGRDRRDKQRMQNWEAVVREWSLRWGDKVSGWWIDGCYTPNALFRFSDPPNFDSYTAALRAGNPNSVVAFNPGVVDRVISFTPAEDYTAGEINDLSRSLIRRAVNGLVDGERIHKLSYLGATWGKGTPRYADLNDVVIPWTRRIAEAGGAMTWDVPVQRNGLISEPFLVQLRAIGSAMRDTHMKAAGAATKQE